MEKLVELFNYSIQYYNTTEQDAPSKLKLIMLINNCTSPFILCTTLLKYIYDYETKNHLKHTVSKELNEKLTQAEL